MTVLRYSTRTQGASCRARLPVQLLQVVRRRHLADDDAGVGSPSHHGEWSSHGDERSVEIWTPRDDIPALECEHLVWHPAGVREPLTLSLEELFRPL